MNHAIGDRIGIVKGRLVGHFGHISDHVLAPQDKALVGYGVRLTGAVGEPHPRTFSGEWFIPTDYVEHVD